MNNSTFTVTSSQASQTPDERRALDHIDLLNEKIGQYEIQKLQQDHALKVRADLISKCHLNLTNN